MKLEELEVLLKVNLEGVQGQINKFKSVVDSAMKSVKNVTSKDSKDAKNNLDDIGKGAADVAKKAREMTDQVKEHTQDVVKNVEKVTAGIPKGYSKGFAKAKKAVGQDVQDIVDEVNAKMAQANAAKSKLASLEAKKANFTGTDTVKFDEQIASAQARMVKFHNQAKKLTKSIKDEFAAVPQSLETIEQKMMLNEGRIDNIRKKLSGLSENLSSQRKPVFKDGERVGYKDTKKSIKTEAEIQKQTVAMNKLIEENDRLQQAYNQVEDRASQLKSHLSGLTTELNKNVEQIKEVAKSVEKFKTFKVKNPFANWNMKGLGTKTADKLLSNEDAALVTGRLGKIKNSFTETTGKMARKILSDQDIEEVRSRMQKLKSIFSQSHFNVKIPSLQRLKSLGGGLTQSENAVSRFGGVFNRVSNSITHGVRRIKNGIGSIAGSTSRMAGSFLSNFGRMSGRILSFGLLFKKQTDGINRNARKTSRGIGGIGRVINGLFRRLVIFGLLYQGVRHLASGLFSALKTNDQFSASLNAIKVNLMTAFYPIYTAILPAVNTLMSAIAKLTGYLAQFIAMLFGTTYQAAKQGAQGLYDNVQAMNDTGSAAGKAKKEVDKLQRSLMGFDEINQIGLKNDSDDSTDAGSGGGMDFGIPEPDTPAWMSKWADKFKKFFEDFFAPIKAAWDKHGKKVIDAWKYALREVGNLIKAIGKSFMEVWTNGSGERFVGNILKLVALLLNMISDIAKAFRKAWEEGGRGTAFIQSIFDLLNDVLELIQDIGESFRNVWNNGTGQELIGNLLDLLKLVIDAIDDIAVAFKNAWNDDGRGEDLIQSLFDALNGLITLIESIGQSWRDAWNSGVGEEIFGNLIDTFRFIGEAISNIEGQLKSAWESGNVGTKIFETILNIVNGILGHIKNMAKATADWGKKLDFEPLLNSIHGLLKSIEPLTENIGSGLEWFYTNVLLPLGKFTIEDVVPAFLDALSGGIKLLNDVIDTLKPLAKWLWDEFLQPMAEWTGGIIVETLKKVGDVLSDIGDWVKEHQSVVEGFVIVIGSFATAWGAVTLALTAWNIVAGIGAVVTGVLGAAVAILTSPITLVVLAIGALIAIGVLLWKNWDEIKEWAGKAWGAIKDTVGGAVDATKKWVGEKWDNIKKATSETWENIKQGTSEKWNSLKESVGEKANQAKELASKSWNSLKENTSSIWGSIKEKTSSTFGSVKDTIQDLAGKAADKAGGAWQTMKDKMGSLNEDMKNGVKGAFETIGNWASDLPGRIANGIRNGISAVGNAVRGIANALLSPIGGAVNGVIRGINWVLSLVGMGNVLSEWQIPQYQQGGTHPGGLALVNDAPGSIFREAIRLPNGDEFIPTGRNVLLNLPAGSQVLNAHATINEYGNIPQYKGGIGSWISGKWNDMTEWVGGKWDKIKETVGNFLNPTHLLSYALNYFTDWISSYEPVTSIIRGMINTVTEYIGSWIGQFFSGDDEDEEDDKKKRRGYEDGGLVNRDGYYRLAEGNKPEMVIPLTKKMRGFQLAVQALEMMGFSFGSPEDLTMTLPTNLTSSTTTFKPERQNDTGDSLSSGLTESIVQAIQVALSNQQATNGDNKPVEITMEVDGSTLGKVAIKEIKNETMRTGVNPVFQ